MFSKTHKDYPESEYRKDSEMMIFHINNVTLKDKTIAACKRRLRLSSKRLRAKRARPLRCKKRLKRLNKG